LFSKLKRILVALTRRERIFTIGAAAVFVLASLTRLAFAIKENSTFVPVAGGSYVEGIVGQPTAVNPIIAGTQADQDIAALVFSPLADLTTSVETDATGRTYSVKLREDLLWDDGEPLTSDDVIFTIRTIQNADARSPLQKNWQGIQVERESELMVRFTLPAPFSLFPENLERVSLIPRHIFGSIPAQNIRLSGYNLQPVGNGPYRIKDFATRKDGFITRYRLVPNERYHGDQPFIKTFTFQFYEQESDLLTAFRLREVQGFGGLLPPDASVQSIPQVVTDTVPMPRYYAVFLNSLNNPALKDNDLRDALSLAIDRERIVREVFGGNATAIESPVLFDLMASGTLPVATPSASTTDLGGATQGTETLETRREAARGALEHIDDVDVALNIVVPRSGFLEQVAAIIKDSWNAIGLTNVTIITVEPDDLTNDVLKSRNYELLLFGNVFQDPIDLFPFWHSSQRFNPGLNLSLYQNTKVDAAIEAIRQTPDRDEWGPQLLKLDTILRAENPATFLVSVPYFYTHTERLNGFPSTTLIVSPQDRFRGVEAWYVAQARVLQ
jgi:peptide/nickel transport system substrate-binding protein